MKNLEIKTIKHGNINVVVKIDYNNGEASLVELQQNSMPSVYKAKSWIFANRTLPYMNGWIEILEAMIFAVKQIKKDLEADLAEKSKFDKKFKNKVAKIALAEMANIAKK